MACRGTLPFMAPELVNTPERINEKADCWSFGMLLWELLTLQSPFQELAPNHIIAGLMVSPLLSFPCLPAAHSQLPAVSMGHRVAALPSRRVQQMLPACASADLHVCALMLTCTSVKEASRLCPITSSHLRLCSSPLQQVSLLPQVIACPHKHQLLQATMTQACLQRGTLRPEIPAFCEQPWMDLMAACWALNPTQRPSFAELAQQLEDLVDVC